MSNAERTIDAVETAKQAVRAIPKMNLAEFRQWFNEFAPQQRTPRASSQSGIEKFVREVLEKVPLPECGEGRRAG